jgi:hypothetical protein
MFTQWRSPKPPSQQSSAAQLTGLDIQIRATSGRARAVVQRIGEARIAERPAPGKWSIAECLTHLRLTSEAYFPLWRQAFESARAKDLASDRHFKLDFCGKSLSWFLEPPPKVRFKAPQKFQPINCGPADRVLHAFLSSQDRLLATIAESTGLPIDRLKITSPFSRRLHYSVWSSFCVTAVHHRRHLWQAERVADSLLITTPS